MAFTVKIVDANDATLFDLNDSTGANNAAYGSLQTYVVDQELSLGVPEGSFSLFEPSSAPGGSLAFKRHGLVQTSWRQAVAATSADNLLTGVGALARLLDAGGILKWQPDGVTEARYLDFIASSIPALLRGQDLAAWKTYGLFDDTEGMPISVWRQPYLRGPQLSSDTNKLTNATLLVDTDGGGRPDSWTWDSTTNITSESVDAAAEAYKFTIATTGTRNLQQTTGAATAAPGDVWTASGYFSSSDAAIGKGRVVVEFLNSSASVLATASGTLTLFGGGGTSFTQFSVTTSAAPASTDRVRMSLQLANATAGSINVWLKRAQLEKAASASKFIGGTETVKNDVAAASGRVLSVYNAGDAPAPVVLTVKNPSGTDNLYGYHVGVIGSGNALYAAQKHYQLESVTFDTDTASAVVTGSSGGSVAQTTFATVATLTRRAYFTTTAISGLRAGVFDVYMRMAITATQANTIQMKWKLSADAGGSLTTEPSRIISSGTLSTNTFFDVRIGRIAVPDYSSLGGLTIELWASRDSGSGNLRMDHLTFVPVSKSFTSVESLAVAQNELIRSDTETPFAGALNSSGAEVNRDLKVYGPQPLWLDPGASLLYFDFGAGWGPVYQGRELITTLAFDQQVSITYKPRYYH